MIRLFRRYPLLLYMLQWLKRVSLPGFRGIPVYFAIRFYFHQLLDESINLKASAIAFNLFLGTIPALMFLLSLLPYLSIGMIEVYIMDAIREGLPSDVAPLIAVTVHDVLATKRGGLLSFTLLIALYFASNGVYAMIETFDIHDPRSFITKRIRAIWMTLAIMFFSVLTIGIYWAFELLLGWMTVRVEGFDIIAIWGVRIMKYVLTMGFISLTVSFIYYYGPRHSMRWKRFSPGAVLTTLLLLITSWAVAYYFEHFARYNLLYGSLGGLIALMLWFYFNAVAIVVGYELNRGLIQARNQLKSKYRGFRLGN